MERRNNSTRRSTGNLWMFGRTFVLLLDPIVTGKIQVVHFIASSQMVSVLGNLRYVSVQTTTRGTE